MGLFSRRSNAEPASAPAGFTPAERAYLTRRPSVFLFREEIVIASRFQDREKIKTLPGGRYDGDTQTWRFPQSRTMAGTIRDLNLPKLTESPEFTALASRGTEPRGHTPTPIARSAPAPKGVERARDTSAPLIPPTSIEGLDLPIPREKTKSWRHQRGAFWFSFTKDAVLLDMKMGTGKSKVICDLMTNKALRRVLIVCPKSVMDVWPLQLERHADLEYEVLKLDDGSVADKADLAARMIEWCDATNKRLVVIVNYESAWRPPFGPVRNARNEIIDRGFALKAKWDAVILDESHRIKSPTGKASRFCRLLRTHAPFRACLTGTPMPHSPLDIWAQFQFLDNRILGDSFPKFRSQIAELGGYGQHQVKRWINQQWLATQLSTITYSVGKEVLDLPPAQHIVRTCTLAPKARETYKKLEQEFYAELDSYSGRFDDDRESRATISNVLVKLLRCQQVTSGYIRDDLGRDIRVDTSKEELLQDILEDVADPVVVFARFQHDLEVIKTVAERLGKRYKELSGRVKELGPNATYPSNCDVLGVQIQSGGVGIDLTGASYGIYYSLDRSLGNYDQSLARLDRPLPDGTSKPVTYYHLLAKDTIDGTIYRALDERRDVVESLSALMKRGDSSHSRVTDS